MIQGTINNIGVESLIGGFRRQADASSGQSPGKTVYADAYLDCITVPPGFIDRICRRAGVQTDAQRRLFNTYFRAVEDASDTELNMFEDILVIDKELVDEYDA